MMYAKTVTLLLACISVVYGQPGKCDQTPRDATVLTPSDNKYNPFTLSIKTQTGEEKTGYSRFAPGQTYVLILKSNNKTRPFKDFMITAEDPEVDHNVYQFEHSRVDVGTLKTLDDDNKATSKHSEKCFSSVENEDKSDKTMIELHWLSPKDSSDHQKIRFRAMAAENSEVWYTGDALTVVAERDSNKALDSPPVPARDSCGLCSEARYQVVFQGLWSRGTHSLHYPSEPDKNKFSRMVGATHEFNFNLWVPGSRASDALKALAETADTTLLEKDIIKNMSATGGTRTLILGKMHQHPHMSDPSLALFRTDRIHHLFSLVVSMQPSPDWFLGTYNFELCTEEGWLDYYKMPLYPWDAGTLEGISYESRTSVTQPQQNVERVALGSFDKASPFYQMNLNDINPFATLEVTRLDVYPTPCDDEGDAEEPKKDENEENAELEEGNAEPVRARAGGRSKAGGCAREWGPWTACVPDDGGCGLGVQTRTRFVESNYYDTGNSLDGSRHGRCQEEEQVEPCFIKC